MKGGFGQFCPVAVACEVFAERWTPMIVREVMAGSEHFNQIHRGVPLMSRALLARRLRELSDAGILIREPLQNKRGYRYRLSPAGLEFGPIVEALGRWGQRWTVRVQPHNLDAGFLMWNIRRRIARDLLPDHRVVAAFNFSGMRPSYHGPRAFWLALERDSVELCIEDPGWDIDLQIDADVAAMAQVWLGDRSFESALQDRSIRLSGNRRLCRAFPEWLMLSHFAHVERPDGRVPDAGRHGSQR